MAEIFRTEISLEEFGRAKVPRVGKYVLVEIFDWNEDLRTKSGVVIGFNPDVLYAEGKDSHIADVARVHGRIVKQPEVLYFNAKDMTHSPSWHPLLETEVGDYVWFHPLISTNCEELVCGDRMFKVIPYDDLFVARKGSIDGEVVPLNGNCVLEILKQEKKSELDVISELGVDWNRGVVAYVGKPNIRYQDARQTDHPDIQVGDVVLYDSRIPPAYLERNVFNTNFDDKQYFVMQRIHLSIVLNR